MDETSTICHILIYNPFSSYAIQLADLKISTDLLEKERDFYFSKLRDVEILCQTPELDDLPVSAPVEPVIFFQTLSQSILHGISYHS